MNDLVKERIDGQSSPGAHENAIKSGSTGQEVVNTFVISETTTIQRTNEADYLVTKIAEFECRAIEADDRFLESIRGFEPNDHLSVTISYKKDITPDINGNPPIPETNSPNEASQTEPKSVPKSQ